MSAWSFYDPTTGAVSAHRYAGPRTLLEANTPPGLRPFLGALDPLRQRVDVATGQVEAWQPPAPAADEWRTWEWDAGDWSWQPVPTLAALWRDVRRERDARMAAFEWRYARHARELRRGDAPTDSLDALDAYIQALADITEQPDPMAIVWPTPPGELQPE